MTKKEIRKAGYQSIFKDGISHQECFENLRQKNTSDLDLLANILSQIPSNGKTKKTKPLIYIFIGALTIILIIKVLNIISLGQEIDLDPKMLLLLVLSGVLIPSYGIYAAIFGKVEMYYLTSIILVINIFRTLSKTNVKLDLVLLLDFIPVFTAIILGFIIPLKLKTVYRKSIVKNEINGELVNRYQYKFEDSRTIHEELLDSTF